MSLFTHTEALAFAALIGTLGLYFLSKRLYQWKRTLMLSPILVVPLVLGAALMALGISYQTYIQDTRWLVTLLGPATIAFAIPIFEQRAVIARHWMALVAGVLGGMAVGVVSSVYLARFFGLDRFLELSLAPRSVTTPFAMEVSKMVGGLPELTAVFVIITGIVGVVIGDILLAVLPLRSVLARGALFGAGAHGVGTAHIRAKAEEEGTMSSLVMVMSGILMVLVGPWLSRFL